MKNKIISKVSLAPIVCILLICIGTCGLVGCSEDDGNADDIISTEATTEAVETSSGEAESLYNVDYCGQKASYSGAKDAYSANEEVTLYYNHTEKDMEYSFYLNDELLDCSLEDGKGYAVCFTMPDKDVKLECKAETVPSSKSGILELNERVLYKNEWSEATAMALVESECTAVLLGSEEAGRHPELAAALSEAAEAQESTMQDEYDSLIGQAKEEVNNPAGFKALVSTIDAKVRRADSAVLSVLSDSYYYNGFNDGSRSLWGGNYDTETGKTIYLPDVVTDMDEFAKAVEDKLFGIAGADVFYNETIVVDYFKEYGAEGTHWTLDYNGVTVYFSEGEIADRGFGAMNATITFAEHPELFKEKYTNVPEEYIVALPTKSAFYTDLNGDGDCEELTVADRYDEENEYQATIDIYTPDNSYTESFWAYDCEPYYVKTADGKHYLYIFTELETQMYLYVYDIANGVIAKVGEANVSPFYDGDKSAVLTNPNSMHFDIFSEEAGGGVSEGNDYFSVGVDGMPAQG